MGRGRKGCCKRGASDLLVRYDRTAPADGCDVRASASGEVFFITRSPSSEISSSEISSSGIFIAGFTAAKTLTTFSSCNVVMQCALSRELFR